MGFLWDVDVRHVIRLGNVGELLSGQLHLPPPPPGYERGDGVHLVQAQGLLRSMREAAEHGFEDGDPLDAGWVRAGLERGAVVVHLAGEGVDGIVEEVIRTLCEGGASLEL